MKKAYTIAALLLTSACFFGLETVPTAYARQLKDRTLLNPTAYITSQWGAASTRCLF